jgi:DNA polymerase sigma
MRSRSQKPEVQVAAARDSVPAEQLPAISQQAKNTLQNIQPQQAQLQARTQMLQNLVQFWKTSFKSRLLFDIAKSLEAKGALQ